MQERFLKEKGLWAIIGLAALFYLPIFQAQYLRNWDDGFQVLHNPSVLNFSFENLRSYFSTFVLRSYQPLASVSFAIECLFFGANPTVHHVTNYFLHLLNIYLVYSFLSLLLPHWKKQNLVVTGLFALNPIQTETVAWISARSTLLCTAFTLLALRSYTLGIEKSRGSDSLRTLFYFTLALFCKSSAITTPVIFVMIDIYKGRKGYLKAIWEKSIYFVLSFIFGLISLESRKIFSEGQDEFSKYYSTWEHFSLSSHSFLFYIYKTLFPYPLYSFYEYPLKIAEPNIGLKYHLSSIFIVGAMAAAIYYRKNLLNYLESVRS